MEIINLNISNSNEFQINNKVNLKLYQEIKINALKKTTAFLQDVQSAFL